MALRRACPGGSTTCGLGACQLNRCSRRDRPDGERDILLSLGSQPVVIPPGTDPAEISQTCVEQRGLTPGG